MKDSQHTHLGRPVARKYIKESNERFSTHSTRQFTRRLSISRRVMKDSQLKNPGKWESYKYIKESNERFSTDGVVFDLVR